MRKIWPWCIAAGVFAADRLTKILSAGIPAEGQVLIPGVIGLRRAENYGIAFSLLSGRPGLLGLLSLVIIAAAFFFLRGRKLHSLTTAGLMMMLGGACGNLTDRLLAGSVPDMVELLFVRFAIFNAADVCLVAGGVLVMADLLLGGRKKHG